MWIPELQNIILKTAVLHPVLHFSNKDKRVKLKGLALYTSPSFYFNYLQNEWNGLVDSQDHILDQ